MQAGAATSCLAGGTASQAAHFASEPQAPFRHARLQVASIWDAVIGYVPRVCGRDLDASQLARPDLHKRRHGEQVVVRARQVRRRHQRQPAHVAAAQAARREVPWWSWRARRGGDTSARPLARQPRCSEVQQGVCGTVRMAYL